MAQLLFSGQKDFWTKWPWLHNANPV